MGQLSRIVAMAFALLLAMAAPAFADHMTGTYSGTGEASGTVLILQQNGVQLQGQFSGQQNGTLFGQTDGGNYVQGYLDEGGIRYTFYGQWSQGGFAITLYDASGNTETVTFVAGGAAPEQQQNPEPQRQDEPQAPQANYYTFQNGTQSGPFTLDVLLGKVASGEVTRETMIWQPGQPQWLAATEVPELAGSLPPAPPAQVNYYVVENGQTVGPLTLQEMIVRIQARQTTANDFAWKDGMEAWAAASTFPEFADALKPSVPPVLPPSGPAAPPASSGPPALPPATTTTTAQPPQPPATTTESTATQTTETVTTTAEPAPTTSTAAEPTTATTTAEPVPPATTSTADVPPVLPPATTTTAEPTATTTTTTSTTEPAPAAPTTTAEATTTTSQSPPAMPGASTTSVSSSSSTQASSNQASSTVSLPDGRNLEVITSGGSMSVSGVNGGYEMVMGGKIVRFANGELTVNGVKRDVPNFATTLTLRLVDGDVTASGD